MRHSIEKLAFTIIVATSLSLNTDSKCPKDMVYVESGFCIDRYEAPNIEGEFPLVMYSLRDSEKWCESRGKRICFSDEWERACVGEMNRIWMYGDFYKKDVCNDSKPWRRYSSRLLRQWKPEVSKESIESFLDQSELMGSEKSSSHLTFLYQGDRSGYNKLCHSDGVYDLLGNVEEWTKKRNVTKKHFSGKLKGRFWSEPRNCIQSVSNHGDLFRFYETGFRCCKDLK